MKKHSETEPRRPRYRSAANRTRITSKLIKVWQIILNGRHYNCPAFDHEDIAKNNLGSQVKLGDHNDTAEEILKGFLKRKKDPDKHASRIVRQTMKKLFDRIITDVICNDVVFVFPKGFAYIVAAQRSPSVKHFRYDRKHRQGEVMVMLVFSKPGYAISKGRKKFINLAPRYKKMLLEELDNGHRYPVIDDVMDKMQMYGNKTIHISQNDSIKAEQTIPKG